MESPKPQIDWHEVARSAIGSAFLAGLFAGALHVIGKAIEVEVATAVPAPTPPTPEPTSTDAQLEAENEMDDAALQAADLLGVTLRASEDEVRAALRAKLANSQLHPDQGGDGERAKTLITAKNFLIEYFRTLRCTNVP
jgi:hypothetical protein